MAQATDAYTTVRPHCRSCGRPLVEETFVGFVYRSQSRRIPRLVRKILRAVLIATPAICLSVDLRLPQPAAHTISGRPKPIKGSIEYIGPWATEVRVILHPPG